MKTKLIALVTAGAIATAGIGAAPAQAGPNDDLARFLIGAAIIGMIANSANNPNTYVRRNPIIQPVTHVHRHKPRTCLRQKWTSRGWVKFYARRCMLNHGWHKRGHRWVRNYR